MRHVIPLIIVEQVKVPFNLTWPDESVEPTPPSPEQAYFARVRDLMRASLQVAVPMWQWQWEYANRPWSELEVIAHTMAKGLAVMSFVLGGVTFLGDHYEATHG